MKKSEQNALEASIRKLCREEKFREATYEAIRGYGPDILGWLTSVIQNETLAEDVFQKTCLSLWKGLPNFQWQSRLLTWIYRIGWHEFLTMRQSQNRRKETRLSTDQLSQLVQEVTTLHSRLGRQEKKDQFIAMRQKLSEELQTLLILRVDREMSFPEISEILNITEETARKRFQRAKEKLKEIARKENLFSGETI